MVIKKTAWTDAQGIDSVRRWEKDINTISVPYLIKIAQHLDVGTDELLGIRKQEG